ncbi:MAG: hypothetical protein DMF50_12110 [Acidobacteria bacterium]|nr:MAG: hypothetical protein DMF50_12110 [Acidobacteriota bacterium]
MSRIAARARRIAGGAAFLALVAALAGAPACASGAPEPAPAPHGTQADARRAEVRFPSGRLFVAEIADTPERQTEGYMFRREVGESDAMIFVFPESGVHPFWMKNTLVPLDMIWMDEDFGVLSIEASAPPCKADPCPGYGPLRKARYVLEVRGGTAGKERLKTGDRLRISFPQPAR